MELVFFLFLGFLIGFALCWIFYNLGRETAKERRFSEEYWNGYRDGRDAAVKTIDEYYKKLSKQIEESINERL